MKTDSEKPPTISYAAILFAVCAYFTKQQYFLFPLAFILFAFYKKQPRLALNYFGLCAGITLILSLCLQGLTGGYWSHLTYAAGLPWEWETISCFLVPFLLDPKTIVAFVIILAGCFCKSDDRDTTSGSFESLAAILLACSMVLAAYTMGLRGAFHNHLLCSEFALFFLSGLMLKNLPQVCSLSFIIAIIFSLQPMRAFGGDLAMRYNRKPETEKTIALLQKNSAHHLVLSEDPSLAIFAGAEPAIIDATTFLNMTSVHPQDLKVLLDNLNQRTYSAVIINTHDAEEKRALIWRGEVLEAILKNYYLDGKSGGNGMSQTVFLPKPSQNLDKH